MHRIVLSSLKYSYIKISYATVAVQNQAILRSAAPCVHCSVGQRNYSRPAVAERAVESVEAKISKLDQTVKRLGRTTLREVQGALREIEAAGSISVTQSLMMIRSCGSLLVEVKPEARTDLTHKIWNLLEDIGVKLDISHYNALLRVYLENDYSFVPSDILSDIEKVGLEPNRVTCQRLIHRYCQMGDIAGATRILQFMREKGMPINESVFNALISGHSKVNDMASAEGILTVMQEGGIQPSSETYALLMCGYIKNGNLKKVEELFKQCESMEIMFSDKDYFDVIYEYTSHGYDDEVDQIINRIRKSVTYNHDAMNFAFKLLTANKEETAFKILKSMLRATRPDGSILPVGNFFIAHLIRNDAPIDSVIKYCRDLMNENLNPGALSIALENALRHGKEEAAFKLFMEAKNNDFLPIRQHYFWPLLIKRGKMGDMKGICEILYKMNFEFGLQPNNETIREYVVPFMLKEESDLSKILLDLKSCGVSTWNAAGDVVTHLLDVRKTKEAAETAEKFNTIYQPPRTFKGHLIAAFLKTHDVKSFISLLGDFSFSVHRYNSREMDSEVETTKIDHREYAGDIIEYLTEKLLLNGRKDILQEVLQKLTEAEIAISEGHVKSIQALIRDELPSGIVDSLEKLSSAEFATPTIKAKTSKFSLASLDDKVLERLYQNSKEKGEKSNVTVTRLLFSAYAKNRDLEKMTQMKEELEGNGFILNTTMQIYEMDALVCHGKLEEALQIYQKLCDSDPNFTLNPTKILGLLALLVKNEQYDRAYEILRKRADLKNSSEEEFRDSGVTRKNFARTIMETLVDRGQVDKAKEFYNLMLTSKVIEPSTYVLNSLIQAHIKREDYEEAMKEFEFCVNTYKATPMKRELALHFIEKEDATNLQKLTDLCTQVHGEINSLVDLMFVFLESGRIKQARKILETRGLRLRPDRLEFMATSFVDRGSAEHLINLLKVTKGITYVDRASIYEKLLSLHVKDNNAQNSLSLWMEIQEEDLQPSDRFLITLANLLKSNGLAVPFAVPEPKKSKAKLSQKSSLKSVPSEERRRETSKPTSNSNSEFIKAIQSDDLDKALALKESMGRLQKSECTKLVERLLLNNRYAEAKECFLDFQKKYNSVIYPYSFRMLMKHAIEYGDIDFYEKVNDKLTDEFKRKIALDNGSALAYLKAGRAEEYISSWEKRLTQIKSKEELEKFLVRFPRTSILQIMNENPQYIPRVEAFAQKCIDIDDKETILPSVLFNFYMTSKNYEKAEEVWNKYLRNTSQIFYAGILKDMKERLDVETGLKLYSYLKNHPQMKSLNLTSLYNNFIDIHVQRNEIEEAKKYLDEAVASMSIETLDSRVLEKLKSACLDKAIALPYEIPERKRSKKPVESSDSDSD